jgi:tetratricopeptide (TPR) repeat protein
MADIFVSYTSSDRDWAFWIANELKALGHTSHIHEWEIKSGDDIYAWMEARHDAADHVLCVVSDAYLKAPYSTLERNAAVWQATSSRPGFVLFVAVSPCRLPTLADHIRRCELYGVPEDAARIRFREFMSKRETPAAVAFPGKVFAVSNIPIRVPGHFMGRDDPLAAIEAALAGDQGLLAVAALYGLRGVGKTTLAAAYAERHRGDYRATWWLKAQTEPTMRAGLIALGVRLNWVTSDEKEERALAAVLERLQHEGEGILLIYDNAVDAGALEPYLPRGGGARVLVTTNAHAWRGVATPVEIGLWPKETGADYLVARTGGEVERTAAEELSVALGGLPLAHEQAAAYCERLDVSLAEYRKRFEAAPAKFLDDSRHAPAEYHDGLTVAKSFSVAIEEAAKLHPAAEPLIVHAAMLAPEPIPLYLFAEAREAFGEPLASALAGDGIDEAVAALRAFALLNRETIADERNPDITTGCIRVHRLVRQVAVARRDGTACEAARAALSAAMAAVYPEAVWTDHGTWPRARQLDPLALDLLSSDAVLSPEIQVRNAELMYRMALYQHSALATFAEARRLHERALAIRERFLGPEHPITASSLNALGVLLDNQGDPVARPLLERALAIRDKALGPEHPDVAESLYNLGVLLQVQGDSAAARPRFERAIAIYEKVRGPDHPDIAGVLSRLGGLLYDQGDLAGTRALAERTLTIMEREFGHEHPQTAAALNDLAVLLLKEGSLVEARTRHERALAIREKALGAEHPETAMSLANLAYVLHQQGDTAAARPLYERALAINEEVHGGQHPDVAMDLGNLARLLNDTGHSAEAESLFGRAIAIGEATLGSDHSLTHRLRSHYARLLLDAGRPAEASVLGEAALAGLAAANGANHSWSKDSARVTADALAMLGRAEEAAVLRDRYGLS